MGQRLVKYILLDITKFSENCSMAHSHQQYISVYVLTGLLTKYTLSFWTSATLKGDNGLCILICISIINEIEHLFLYIVICPIFLWTMSAYFLHHDLHLSNGKINNTSIMPSNFVLKAKNKTKNGRRISKNGRKKISIT